MPSRHIVVSAILRFEPPIGHAPAEVMCAAGGLTLELEAGRTARLAAHTKGARAWAKALAGIHKLRRPIYLELDPSDSTITRVLFTLVGRVLAVDADPGRAGLRVQLDQCYATHFVDARMTNFAQIERELRRLLRSGALAIVSETDAHELIDVRAYRPERPLPWTRKWLWRALQGMLSARGPLALR